MKTESKYRNRKFELSGNKDGSSETNTTQCLDFRYPA